MFECPVCKNKFRWYKSVTIWPGKKIVCANCGSLLKVDPIRDIKISLILGILLFIGYQIGKFKYLSWSIVIPIMFLILVYAVIDGYCRTRFIILKKGREN